MGFVTKNESQEMLLSKPNGTFLLRFSDSELGGITIAWVADQGDKGGVLFCFVFLVFFLLLLFFRRILLSKQNSLRLGATFCGITSGTEANSVAPAMTSQNVASHLGLFWLLQA